MPVIAMNQEMGSLGKEVAETLAADLGLKLVRQEIYEHVAGKMQVKKSLVRRVMEGKAGFLDRWQTNPDDISLYTSEGLFEVAAEGNVLIRGWGATHVLRRIPHVLSVRVCAPLERRVRTVMGRLETDDEDFVREEIEKSDAVHASNLQTRFGVRWGDPMIYDLVLNTERLSVASCVKAVKHALTLPEFQETPESQAQLHNLALEARVRALLRADPATSEVNITIEADGGKVTLAGIVINDKVKASVAEVVSRAPRVSEVTDNLRVMASRHRFTHAKYQ
jgi:cytidylate kinase